MRTIKFRGKRLNDGEWIYGVPYGRGANCYILICDKTSTPEMGTGSWLVDPATVGQFTGLTDKNGKEIFEGDIVIFQSLHLSKDEKKEVGDYNSISLQKLRFLFPEKFNTYVVGWEKQDAAFCMLSVLNGGITSLNTGMGDTKQGEVIGSIHSNPELLKNE